MAKDRENFSSRFTVVMAMAGSAIGLGNIWRFPYMVGQNGGAAFIIVYLLSAVFLSLPIFLSESIIGRATNKATFGAMEALAPGSKWKWLGLLTVASPLLILSYYSVVGGWSIEYFVKSMSFRTDAYPSLEAFSSSSWLPLACHSIFMLLCALIVLGGVSKGIEKFSKITTPLLFLLILVIALYSITLPGASEGVKYLVKPDFSKLTASAVASAMGQSFFSLSLGVGTMLTYASYVSKKEDLMITGLGTSVFDLLFAVLAGFAIMPAVFAAGIEPGAGPGLIFDTLPFIFGKMSGHLPAVTEIIAFLFFLTILVSALTSAISMMETGVAYLIEEHGMSRKKALAIVTIGCWTVGVLCSLSFGSLSGISIMGKNIFGFCDSFASNFLMPLGGMLFTLFVGWKMSRKQVRDEFTNNGTLKLNCALFNVVYFLIRYVAPIVIAVIFITNIFI